VHSKLTVIDDDLMLAGSADLSNRSTMLRIECTIAVDANGDPHIWSALRLIGDTLLAEHPGCEPEGSDGKSANATA
jgi:phosphatidylserine/phosphatidylglycerophosphate/cardiolipin synthase-like enzyme